MAEETEIIKVKAGGFEFYFTQADIDAADCIHTSPGKVNLLKDHHSVNATLLDSNDTGKAAAIEVDGERFDVVINDQLDQVLDKMGFGASSGRQIKDIKAPMPGLVLDIAVTEGAQVNEGDKILILGAMKMENSILIHTAATIKKIHVSPGQAVEKGQLLVSLE